MRGVLTFEASGPLPASGSVRLRVIDTSRVGADAVLICEKRVTLPQGFDASKDQLPFEISVPDQRRGLTIQAHLAGHNGTDIRKGDLITTAAILLPAKENDTVVVPLRVV